MLLAFYHTIRSGNMDEPGIPPNIPIPVPGGKVPTPQKHEQEHSAPPLPLTSDPAAGGAATFAAGGVEVGGAGGGGTEAGGGGGGGIVELPAPPVTVPFC